jgi:hypothetical protein
LKLNTKQYTPKLLICFISLPNFLYSQVFTLLLLPPSPSLFLCSKTNRLGISPLLSSLLPLLKLHSSAPNTLNNREPLLQPPPRPSIPSYPSPPRPPPLHSPTFQVKRTNECPNERLLFSYPSSSRSSSSSRPSSSSSPPPSSSSLNLCTCHIVAYLDIFVDLYLF